MLTKDQLRHLNHLQHEIAENLQARDIALAKIQRNLRGTDDDMCIHEPDQHFADFVQAPFQGASQVQEIKSVESIPVEERPAPVRRRYRTKQPPRDVPVETDKIETVVKSAKPVAKRLATTSHNYSRSVAFMMESAPPHVKWHAAVGRIECLRCGASRNAEYMGFLKAHEQCQPQSKRQSTESLLGQAPKHISLKDKLAYCAKCESLSDKEKHNNTFLCTHAVCTREPWSTLLAAAPSHVHRTGNALTCTVCGSLGKSHLIRWIKNHRH